MVQPLEIRFLATDPNAWSVRTLLRPTLTDPNTRTTLFHANPIIQYLVDHYDHTNALSTTATTTEKHLLNQWLHLQTTLSSSSSPNPQFHNVLATLNTALTNKSWLVGERCSYADLAFLPGLHGLASPSGGDGLGLRLMRPYPFVAAWVGRMETRGAWGRVLAIREGVLRDVAADAVRPEEEGLLDGESEWEEIEGCSVAVDRVEEDEGGSSVQAVAIEAAVRMDQTEDYANGEEREGMMPCAAGFALQRVSTARQVLRHEHRGDDDDDDDEREGILPCVASMLHAHAIPSQMRSGEAEDREGILPCGAFAAHAKQSSNATMIAEHSDDDEREGILPCGAFGAHAQHISLKPITTAEVHDDDNDDNEREGMLPCTVIGLHSKQLPPKTTVVESESDSDDEKEGFLPCGAFGAHAQHVSSTTTPEVEVEDDDDGREGILPCGAFIAHTQHAPSTVEAEINNDNDDDEKEGMLPCAGIGMPTPYATCNAEDDDFEREGMPPCSLMGMVY
ncbi:hypothetical protein ASPACDRAFT_38211 [Aspergillus aculeatus ATCC 16872]|uniref:glutathione transferase n=1 Tax=Aspergillus aculeatus (strain ATCC 16872 / CBS 172.66 / WB 5094) TaxID=690307 RepID=A0A1L9X889_ASPA1|nr:uncharacterized protein ASPACDRAFT_38211 [Aspergillus aculeatus ATCC 16872]OJK04650.1 hypothetical protein ASPACDRAFT_38211 [Aspergillus aculeatus ATCC 16872]